jgi:putative endonuclease
MGSLSGTLYIGMSSTLYKRVFMHKNHLLEGFTAQYKVDRLLYVESFDDVHKAIAREKQLKGWRRDRKIALFERVNPHWVDLAKDWYPETKPQFGDRGASTTPEHSLRACSSSAQHDNIESAVASQTSNTPSTQNKT